MALIDSLSARNSSSFSSNTYLTTNGFKLFGKTLTMLLYGESAQLSF